MTVTYADGSKQRRAATILVKTPCQNPTLLPNPVVTYVGATVSWVPTAESYKVSWKKTTASTWNSYEVGNVTSYTITGLEYQSTYQYKVQATSCTTSDPEGPYPTFTTLEEPGLMVTGAIFGGGRMANVTGKTEVTIINCDSVGTIYGGNDIAGKVLGNSGADGSTITLGTNATTGAIHIGSVYGGGNGYYSYGTTDFEPVTENTVTLGENASVYALSQTNEWDTPVWTNGSASVILDIPSISKTAITVSNDYVKVDSIFGGAKNAFLTNNSGNGSSITIDGGTIFAVFGANNVGGGQGYGYHHIVVNKTTTNLVPSIANTATTGYGRDFGIRYLFGGGNKVEASTTDVYINGGQCDTVFAGGNAADVYKAYLTVNCSFDANTIGDGITYGDTYTNAVDTYTSGVITPKTAYAWNGYSGIYNVRTLFGGNNKASMDAPPTLQLTSGSIGMVYGGGNAGDMMGHGTDDGNGGTLTINGKEIRYGTHVVLNSATTLVDFLYGGCQMSDVEYSTWVELKKGHVGTVYGGCNISGDVGSTRVNPEAPTVPQSLADQEVLGATYVVAGGSNTDNIIVYNDIFAGSNGYYDCSSNGITYNNDTYFNDPTGQYAGLDIPTHNETNVVVHTGATIKGNVYAGGNLARVGFYDATGLYRGFPERVGMASVRMDGGTVEKNVYGGGNMASIYGSNEVRVSGGTIGLALYGGNDRAGQVAEISNRILPSEYTYASDGRTQLIGVGGLGVKTYVSVSGSANIGTVYGGGNGAYPAGSIQYCYEDDEPVQSNTFVDININGGAIADGGGKIRTVYGGGNGVTTWDGVTVFFNVDDPVYDRKHVDTIFGGNNMGNLDVVPDIRLVHGQVGTVYGGCNRGAMTAGDVDAPDNAVTVGGYEDIGSYVRLLDKYIVGNHQETVDVKVTEAVYGGCRMNGVSKNSLVLVEGGNHSAIPLFGGSDISGTVSGFSRVAVTGGTVGNVYGGGNGNYDYVSGGNVYQPGSEHIPANLVATGITAAPICAESGADILGGQVGTSALLGAGTVSRVFGAGYGKDTETTGNIVVNIGNANAANAAATPTIYGEIYGGSAFGNVNTAESSSNHYTTTVNFLNGTLKKATINEVDYGGNLFGGGLGRQAVAAVTDPETGTVITPAVEAIAALVKGKVFVKIGDEDQTDANCFIDLRDANVFGCNNANGSPQDDVRVDVWRTAYDFTDDEYDYSSQNGEHPHYAINQVFGGGNRADYLPQNGAANSTKKATVYVHNCLNTISRVFSGGNAAAATGVTATIEGGRFDYIFGGGNGEVEPANIGLGGTNLTLSAGIVNHLFGGSNSQGAILGPVITTINGENIIASGVGVEDPCGENITEFFGGSNEADLNTNVSTVVECGSGLVGSLYGGCNKADIVGDVLLTVQGGQYSEVYGGSKGVSGSGGAADITGNVTLNLEGGTIGTAFGGSNVNGNITGNIIVNVIDREECPLDITNVFGAGNLTDYTPSNASITSPIVNVMHLKPVEGGLGIRENVYGGGNQAEVTANPKVNFGYDATTMSSFIPADINTSSLTNFPHAYVTGNVIGGGNLADVNGNTTVNVFNGEIVHKLVGGGNAADINGDVLVNIMGGNVSTEPTGVAAGVYGGCNESGNVTGDVILNITGDNTTQTTIGNEDALDAENPVSVHGGGFGHLTSTNGNVTVNFGIDEGGENSAHCEYPMLYGDMYGGSALGTVNDNEGDDETTVNVLNGSVKYYVEGNVQFGGNIYGGGLGNASHAATVNGEVHVNIGADTQSGPIGKASLKHCNVYGCNNENGSPQQQVYVDVYQTVHTRTDSVQYLGDDYAIERVYGGGNRANYAPLGQTADSLLKVHNYIHYCDNTIRRVYGGGNAANADGVVTNVDGGRFEYIFGGGNGQVTPANILGGGINLTVCSGHIGWKYVGCDMGGTVVGKIHDNECSEEQSAICNDTLIVDYFFFGANKATIIGGLQDTIFCDDEHPMNYVRVYAGSRLAVVYGDISILVRGGNITHLFGGSQGDVDVSADVRKFPANPATDPNVAEEDRQDLIDYMAAHPGIAGTGGNIYITLEGGTVHNVYGGNDKNGNVEGEIVIVVNDQNLNCPLVIDTIYGGNNQAVYAPDLVNGQPIVSPQVYVKNGRVNYDVFGGSLGGDSHYQNAGQVTSCPKVVIGDNDPAHPNNTATIGRDVFGGGSSGKVIGNTQVILQGKATIGFDVFGGGKNADVDGNTDVIIVPPSTTPTPGSGNGE